ncbi:hypothetical protein GCM10028798_08870 [Humibacter antri]
MRSSHTLNRLTATVAAAATALALAFVGTAGAASTDPAYGGGTQSQNVALASAGATVTASGQEEPNEWGPANAIDGDATTRWSSNYSDSAWITVKLAKSTVIDHVTILWEAACAAQYKLQVSNDGTNFTDATGTISPTCGTKTQGAADTEKLTKVDSSTAYQYVRMQGIKRTEIGGAYWGISLFEFQVWSAAATAPTPPPSVGQNVALASAGATATASGQEVPDNFGPALAIDGDTSTRWSSNKADDAWITVELAKPTVIDHVVIDWQAACAAQYKLQVSNDGTNFTDATGVISPTCGTSDTEKLTKVSANTAYQYVRVQGIKRTAVGGVLYGISLFEFEVWNGPEPIVAPSTADGLTPKPQNLTVHSGAAPFQLTAGSRIVTDPALTSSADFLATQLRASTGFALPVVTSGARDGDIVFSKGDVSAFPGNAEAYALDSSAARVTVTAPTAHGAFDAVQTIRQLLPAFAESPTVVQDAWTIPSVTITDAPRFGYRGIMLDVARSFQTVPEVEQLVNEMALFKMSVLHLHLADDQGWRIQITNDGKAPGDPIDYSRLTAVSGATAMTQEGYQNELGHTGYYTQADYKAMVAYAAARQITIIPEIDAPAHTNAVLHAIPQLNTTGTQPAVDASGTVPANGTGSVGYSTLDANAPITWTFMTHVLTQLAAMTPGDYIDVGGDESHVTGTADYKTFVTKSVQIVHGLGKKAIGWNEAAVGGLTAGDGLQYWYGDTADTLNAVKNDGAKILMSTGSNAYLDQKYTSSTPIGLTWLGAHDFQQSYNWNPAASVQDNGANLPDSDILGVEGPLWSETIRGGSQAQFLAFPRAIALAEVGWTAQSNRNLSDFTSRLAYAGADLLAMHLNFYDSPGAAWQWSMAGLPVAVSPGRNLSLSVGELAAPGTEASTDGSSVSTDTASASGGVGNSTVGGGLTATVDWGDGTPATAAIFATDTARTSLSAGGLYSITGTHVYAASGTYTGIVTASDGTKTTFVTTVKAGTPDPTGPAPWDSSQPAKLTVSPTADAGGRLAGTLSGFEPGSYVTMTIGSTDIGAVRPGPDGTLALQLPVAPSTYAGDYTVTATAGSRTATAPVHIDSNVVPLKDQIDQKTLTIGGVDSQETSAENAPASNAIDGDPNTYWHTQYSGASPDPYPHWIVLDLGKEYDVSGFSYLQRAGNSNGRMKDFEVYVGDSLTGDWGNPVMTGSFQDITTYAQVFEFSAAKTGRYLKLVGLDSINGLAFGGAAEINVGGLPHVTPPSVTASASSVAAGGSLTLNASDFAPSTQLTIALHEATPAVALGLRLMDVGDVQLGTATTDASGALQTQVTIPAATAPGAYTVVVTQPGGTPLSASVPLSVTAASTPGSGGTGGDGQGGTGAGTGGSGGSGPGGTSAVASTTQSGNGSASARSGLASTGSDVMLPVSIGLIALLAGFGIVVARLRRRSHR